MAFARPSYALRLSTHGVTGADGGKKEISLEYLTEEKQAIFETHHEPIIDRDTWERVQELRKQHKRRGKLRRQEIEIYYSFVGKVELPD